MEKTFKNYVTIKKWTPKYPEDISLKKGDLIKIGKEDNEWKGWIWCFTENNSGWVPKQIIKLLSDSKGELKEDYIARELSVDVNENIISIKEINGWIWGRQKSTSIEGWLPKQILKELKN